MIVWLTYTRIVLVQTCVDEMTKYIYLNILESLLGRWFGTKETFQASHASFVQFGSLALLGRFLDDISFNMW